MELTVKRVNLVFFMLLMEQTVKENPVMLELQVSQEAKDQRVNEEMMDPRVTRVNLDPLGSLEPPELKESLVLRVNRVWRDLLVSLESRESLERMFKDLTVRMVLLDLRENLE